MSEHDEERTETLPALYAELERLGAEAKEWVGKEASESTAMVHVGSNDPEKVREQMLAVRREARDKARDLEMQTDKVRREIRREVDRQREIIDAQRRDMEAQMQAQLAALEPLKAQVKRMEEGIWTVNLYLGTSEEIATLRTGDPAAAHTPITMRTEVLAMDEEVASFPDSQGMDYRDIEEFDQWLVASPEHLQQVIPEPKGIVVFTPRRTEKIMHEDPLVNIEMNKPNFESYWLIRNGENLYRLQTDFAVGRTLMPVTREFTALFQREVRNRDTGEWETREIEPGTEEWAEAEKAQDAKRRHYMRVALILQGLIDRTEMFEPLPGKVNVMHQSAYDDGLVVVVNDTERQLTTSREPYYDWIRRLNRDLRPGMRIIGTFRGSEWGEYEFRADVDSRAEGNERLSPHSAERPPAGTLLQIEARRTFRGQQGLVVRYKRTQEVWSASHRDPVPGRPGYYYRGGGYRVPKQRASAVLLPTDITIIPFDLVTEEEMQAYLDARTERHAYADSFPLLQAAITAKREEREAEEPFRALIAQTLAADTGHDLDEVRGHVGDLVHRFKLGNKWHRPLVSLSQEDEAKALRLIRAEYKRIAASGATEQRDAAAVKTLREHDPAVMFVGRLSSGKYVAFAPQPRSHPEGVVSQRVYVREHTTGKTAARVATREWVVPGNRGAKMTALFTTDQWVGWDSVASAADHLTDDETTAVLVEAREQGMRRIRSAHGAQCRYLATRIDPTKRLVRVYASDGIDGAPTRVRLAEDKPMVRYFESDMQWSHRSDGLVLSKYGRTDSHDFRLHRDSHFRPYDVDNEKFVSPFKDQRAREHMWGMGSVRLTLVDVDEDVLADAEKALRATMKVNQVRGQLEAKIRVAKGWIDTQQCAAQIAEIKAAFLAEYPDEDMWEDRKVGLTRDVKPTVELEPRWPRDEHDGKISDALRLLIDSGTIEWDGLVVRDVYDLLGEKIPDAYQPIAHLHLTEETDPT